ncbi:MAG: FGGY-family carbohydrate kinase, partial [Actinobacteria bacterium]|nr:FGGY-family carbohydrate kinase [Actinomycetota bacterium]
VRAMVDAMANAMSSPPLELRVDGGAAAMNLLLEIEAAQVKIPVLRPQSLESTALGAAYLAGLAEGFFDSPEHIASLWQEDTRFVADPELEIFADLGFASWLRSLERSKDWEQA